MKFYKRKVYNMFIMKISFIGMLMYKVSMFLRNNMTGFPLGFIKGIAIALIIFGIIHMIICFINKRNPYIGENIRRR